MIRHLRQVLALVLISSLVSVTLWHDTAMAATTTCMPDPNVEVSTVDGRIINSDAVWSTARSAAAGTSANDSANIINVNAQEAGNYFIYRSIVLFDCSAIPDTDVISAATITLTSDTTRDGGEANSFVVIVGASNPASNTAVVADDFDQVGTTTMSDSADLTSWTSGTQFVFTLNASGIANVSKTGISKFGIKTGHDVNDVAPGAGVESGIDIRSADYAGTSSDPLLTVTHAPASPFLPILTEDITFIAKPEPFFEFA